MGQVLGAAGCWVQGARCWGERRGNWNVNVLWFRMARSELRESRELKEREKKSCDVRRRCCLVAVVNDLFLLE